MKRQILKVSKWLYLMLAGMLGLTQSCNLVRVCEYGTPNADFTFSGKVTDKDGKPIEGIEVRGNDRDREYSNPYDPSTLTDKNGDYILKHERAFPVEKYYLRFKDIDGEKNGSFKTVEKEIKIDKKDYTGDTEGWFDGYVNIGVNTIMDEAELTENEE